MRPARRSRVSLRLASLPLLLAFAVAQAGSGCLAICFASRHLATGHHAAMTEHDCQGAHAVQAAHGMWDYLLSPALHAKPTVLTLLSPRPALVFDAPLRPETPVPDLPLQPPRV